MELKINNLHPFLKWPGGKRWFVRNYSYLLPTKYNRYIEPFLGGGSVFFYLRPDTSVLGDINPDIIAVYEGLKTDWRYIKRSLQYHQRMHSDDHYYKVRECLPTNPLQRASRMLYLNRTCFNGIYRVNLEGKFNVPRGSKNEVLLENDDFEAISSALSNATIRLADFELLIDDAVENDLIFVDPPYTVRHNLNGFIKYNEVLFSWEDQERLAKALIRARDRGAQIVSTNANHDSIRDLYENNGFNLKTISRFSSISATSTSRKQFEELVILSSSNFPIYGNADPDKHH
jgi:DNA adenine methylase